MKLRNALCSVALTFSFASTTSGQLQTTENPFPETGVQEDSSVFDIKQMVPVTGVITQRVSRAIHSPSYLFLRVQATKFGSGIWTVRVYDPRVNVFANNCRECLIDDYTLEMQKLGIGVAVTLKGHPSKNGDQRLLADVRNISASPLNSN
jgi:hypothetical protein